MKKYISAVLVVFMICQSVYAGDISVNLDGENIEFSAQSPVIIEGRTLIPLRGVFEKLGYEIGWDGDTKTATFVKELTIVKVTENAHQLTVGGKAFELDVPAQIINGSMMLPLRAVGEATGLYVDWDSETKTVVLSGESTDTRVNSLKDNKGGTVENLSSIKTYVDVNRALTLGYTYVDQIFEYMYVGNEVDFENMDYERIISFNDITISKTNTIDENKYNKDILEAIRSISKSSTGLFTKMKNIVSSGERGKTFIDDEFDDFMDKLSNLYIIMEDSADDYMDYIEDYDWDEDKLNDEQIREIRAYQKKVGNIIDEAFSDGIGSGNSRRQGAEKIRKAAKKIKDNVSKLTPPDFAQRDDDILFAGCDILNEAADLYEKMSDDDIEMAYYKSLIMTFEVCAKSCAGDYYLIESFND